MKSPGRGMPGHSEEPRYRKTLPKGVDTYGLQSVSVLVRAQRLPDQPWKPRHGRGFGADGFDGFVLRKRAPTPWTSHKQLANYVGAGLGWWRWRQKIA